MKIRNATIGDASTIASIYNYYIKNSVITFEEELVDKLDMSSRIETISTKYPYLVIEDDEKVLGYAYTTYKQVRSAYRFSAKVTIYLYHEASGKGFGSQLFSALLNQLLKTNLHALVGGIALPNNASVALHEKFGFKKVSHFEEIGFKFGKWVVFGYWELKL